MSNGFAMSQFVLSPLWPALPHLLANNLPFFFLYQLTYVRTKKLNKIELYMISQNINSETKTNPNILLDYIKGKLNTDQTKQRIK